MAQEAIQGYLESLLRRGEPVPKEGEALSFNWRGSSHGFFFRVTAQPEVPVYAEDAAHHRAEVG